MFNPAYLSDYVTELDWSLLKAVSGCMRRASATHQKCMAHKPKAQLVFNCHSISRGVALMIPKLTVVDGNFLGFDPRLEWGDDEKVIGCEHSWLKTPDGAIIDPYPVHCLTLDPVLVPANSHHHAWSGALYVPRPDGKKMELTPKLWRMSRIFHALIARGKTDKPSP